MTDDEINKVFNSWYADQTSNSAEEALARNLLLAHYTSIYAAENMIKSEQIWFSNPLYMNDIQELHFGVDLGIELFLSNEKIFGSSSIEATAARRFILQYLDRFREEQLLDVYVSCFSEHDADNSDGLLSMWRGYGHQGSGAAIVVNTKFVSTEPLPILIYKVTYLSDEKRRELLRAIIDSWCDVLLTSSVPNDKVYIPVYHLFNALVQQALISKHEGFKEEREWRLIYLPDYDDGGLLKDRFGYIIGNRGVEPKLKLPIRPLPNDRTSTWSFNSIIEKIILGPTNSSFLAKKTFVRMLESIGKHKLGNKVYLSTIPLRPA